MPVGATQVACPSCGETVELTVGGGRTVVGTGTGHRDEDDVLDQLCTNCLDPFHVEVE